MNKIKIFKTIKYTLGTLSICTLMSIATFSTQTKAEVSGEKVTTSVEAVTTKPSESTKTTETTKPAETTKPQETTKASNIKKSTLNPVKSKVILLDPGHCKKHIGARGNGLKEEDVNLDIGKACRNYLNKYSDVTVYMTRTNSKCVKKLKLGDCLTARNHLAKRLSADAKDIINYYKLSAKNIEGDFQTISGKTYFVDKEGNKIAGWVKKDGKWYHFNNKTAVMNKGFFKEAGNKFYLNPKTGEMTSGWFTISGKSYLAKGNGVVVTNQIYTDGVKSYFFKKSGKRKNGWVTYKNAKYYFSKTKGMLKGKQKIKGKRYTFSKKTGKLKKKK